MIGMVLVTHGALAEEFRAALEHVAQAVRLMLLRIQLQIHLHCLQWVILKFSIMHLVID